ncbi:MAG: 4-oxalocrotonate tautomerase family protein [Acidobacteria bacterium]|nr:4-oxalocrotonate tautomerase family protein [Acidobacteriota bacterium]
MPHVSIKMVKGRSEAQKDAAAKAVKEALMQAIGAGDAHVSVSVEDFTPQQWQDVFKAEITDKPEALRIAPQYDPKDLL